MGTLLRSCAEVHAATELPFGMVSGVTQAFMYLLGVHVPQREGWIAAGSAGRLAGAAGPDAVMLAVCPVAGLGCCRGHWCAFPNLCASCYYGSELCTGANSAIYDALWNGCSGDCCRFSRMACLHCYAWSTRLLSTVRIARRILCW